jgi:hypothetical protein
MEVNQWLYQERMREVGRAIHAVKEAMYNGVYTHEFRNALYSLHLARIITWTDHKNRIAWLEHAEESLDE